VAGKERKIERWGKVERETEGEVQEEHLKAKRTSFIHERLSALCTFWRYEEQGGQ
jgi:hypothetical protein